MKITLKSAEENAENTRAERQKTNFPKESIENAGL